MELQLHGMISAVAAATWSPLCSPYCVVTLYSILTTFSTKTMQWSESNDKTFHQYIVW
jgi:hypothetical protein